MRTIFSVMALGSCFDLFHPGRVALVAERGHALRAFAAHLARERLRGAIEDGREFHLGAFLQQRLGRGIRARRAAGNALENGQQPGFQASCVLGDEIDETDALGLGAVDALAREREPARARLADARDDEGRDLRRHQAERGFAEREFRVRAREHDVGGAGEAEAAAHGRALDHRHQHFGQARERDHEIAEAAVVLRDRIDSRPARRALLAFLEIAHAAAGAEKAVGAAQHHRAQRRVRGGRDDCRLQFFHHLRAERVARRRIVQGQKQEAALAQRAQL